MKTIEAKEISALILCGGQAQRMGGQDKGLILLQNKALVTWAIDRCKDQVGSVLLNANRHIDQYQILGWPVKSDITPDYPGPLAGFQVGLTQASTPYVLIIPCDTPLFPVDLVERLSQAMTQSEVDCTYAMTIENGSEQVHPVFCLLKKTTLESLNLFLQTGQRKIDRWFASLSHQKVLFNDPKAFLNINTPEELLQIEQSLS